MTGIFLLRHGETAWNQEKIFRGMTDVPLSDRGRQQAQALADALAKKQVRFVYSSPLSRAADTAKAVAAKSGLGVELLDGLADMNFGEWEGKTVKEVETGHPELYKQWVESPELTILPGGETLARARQRAMTALGKIVDAHPDQAGVVVSHRVICKLILLTAMSVGEAGFWRIQQDLACMNLLEWDGRNWTVRSMNLTSHLQGTNGNLKIDF